MSENHVQDHYAQVALDILDQLEDDTVCGCQECEGSPVTAGEARDLYTQETLTSLPQGALAASRGCGDPVSKANLQPGERVVDLGSGGGIDALIAGTMVGQTGHVFGVDMTPEMVELATRNAQQAGFSNVEFIQGTIEALPLPDESVDVVLSNCVINFSDDKLQVMREAARVLRPGGRFVVSDIVSFAPIAQESYGALCRIVGCTKGMRSQEEYRDLLAQAGFSDIVLEPKTTYTLEVLRQKAEKKDRMDSLRLIEDDADLDAVSGSVIIYATK